MRFSAMLAGLVRPGCGLRDPGTDPDQGWGWVGAQRAHIVADGGLGQLAKVVEDGEELLVPRHCGLGGRERLQRPVAALREGQQ